jgi:AraC family transcriptional regulator
MAIASAAVLARTTGQALSSRSLKTLEMAVTEVRSNIPNLEVSEAPPAEDAFFAVVMLRDFPNHVCWEENRQSPTHDFRAGDCIIKDLQRQPTVLMSSPMHFLDFYLPRTSPDQIAEDANAPRIPNLAYAPGELIKDAVLGSLGHALLDAFQRPEQANQLFLHHVMIAVATHVARTYGELEPGTRKARGGLAGWQERRAKELLAAHLTGQIALHDVAVACSLSVSHFSRAFRETTGLAPHQLLLHRRIEAAKSAMQDARLPLSEITLTCGFADQSHFTRVFSKQVGVSPGCWRRYAEIGPADADRRKLLPGVTETS